VYATVNPASQKDLTPGDFMYFVLDEVVYQRHESGKETPRDEFAVFQCDGVVWGQGNNADGPWKST